MKSKVRGEIFFLIMTFFIILCLSITPLFAQYPFGYGMYGSQWWILEAKDVGTTIIKIDCGSFLNTASCGSTFKVEITVKD